MTRKRKAATSIAAEAKAVTFSETRGLNGVTYFAGATYAVVEKTRGLAEGEIRVDTARHALERGYAKEAAAA